MHYFLADSLTGAGYQRMRMIVQISVAIFNVGLNLWLIPAYSWRGAAWSSLASDGALVLAMYAAVMFMMAKEARMGVGLAGQRLEQESDVGNAGLRRRNCQENSDVGPKAGQQKNWHTVNFDRVRDGVASLLCVFIVMASSEHDSYCEKLTDTGGLFQLEHLVRLGREGAVA